MKQCIDPEADSVCCSFTLEASFAGPNTGAFAGSHYDTSQLESIGANLALALLDYSDPVQATKATSDMKTALQAPEQVAAAGQEVQCVCESSGGLSDGTAAVSTKLKLTRCLMHSLA